MKGEKSKRFMCVREKKDEKRLLNDRNINLTHKCFTTLARVQSEEIFQILFMAEIFFSRIIRVHVCI